MGTHVGPGSHPERFAEVFRDLHFAFTNAHPRTQEAVLKLIHDRWAITCPICAAAHIAYLGLLKDHSEKRHFSKTIEVHRNDRLIELENDSGE